MEEYLFDNSRLGIEHEMFEVVEYPSFGDEGYDIWIQITWKYQALTKLYDLSCGYSEGDEIYLDDILYSLLTDIKEQMDIRGLL